MATVTVTVNASVEEAGADNIAEGYLRFVLDRVDVDEANNEVILDEESAVAVASDGSASINLWPNSRGAKGSRYKVYRDAETISGTVTFLRGDIEVPEAGSPHDLGHLLIANISGLQGYEDFVPNGDTGFTTRDGRTFRVKETA